LRVRFALLAARRLIQDLFSVQSAVNGWTLSLRRLMKLLLSRRLLCPQRKPLHKQPYQILFARRVEPSSSPEPAFVRIADSH